MSRSIPSTAALILVVAFASASPDAWARSAKEKREAAYQAALRSYSEALKPGMTRKDVEDYFRKKDISFQQIYCIDEKSAYADLVRIGKEKPPQYCGEHNIYIAFQFVAGKPHGPYEIVDSDVLKTITIWHHLENCV